MGKFAFVIENCDMQLFIGESCLCCFLAAFLHLIMQIFMPSLMLSQCIIVNRAEGISFEVQRLLLSI